MNKPSAEPIGLDMPLSRRENVNFWRDQRFAGMECLSATFHTMQFSPHSHDTFGIGAMELGTQKYRIKGASHTAGAGDLYLFNPEEMHEGRPLDEGYRYHMVYPSLDLMREVMEDIAGRPLAGTPSFKSNAVSAPNFAREFIDLHRRMATGRDALETDSRFFDFLTRLMQTFGAERIDAPETAAQKNIIVARDYLDAHFADDVSLAEVAAAAGLSRAHLVRSFRKTFHAPPHAWLTDRRIREARRLLKAGATIADTAIECGFADQPHLTRHFKARCGVTPAVFREKSLA